MLGASWNSWIHLATRAVALRGVANGGLYLRPLQAIQWRRVSMSLWQCLKKGKEMFQRSVKLRLGPNRHLLFYGVTAFLWERERIHQDDLERCLQYYEDRVRASVADTSTPPPTQHTQKPQSSSYSWMFGWFTRGPSQVTSTEEPQDETIDEKEIKRQQLVAELTALYTERSQQQMSQLPLVGLSPRVSTRPQFLSKIVSKTRHSMVGFIKRALKQNTTSNVDLVNHECYECCEGLADLSCIGAEVHSHAECRVFEDWFDFGESTYSTLYPLIGLQTKRSNIIGKISKAISRPYMNDSLEKFVHIFDQIIGVDCELDRSVLYQANHLCESVFQSTLKIAHNFLEEDSINSNKTKSPEGQSDSSIDRLSGWELFLNEKSYRAYRKPYADTGLFQFKVIGSYDDVTAKDFYGVQMNGDDRLSWDHYVTRLDTVDFDPNSGCEVVHWVMRFPFPLASREYVYVHKSWVSQDEDAIVFVNRSVTHPTVPESNSAVRVKDYYSEMVIKAHTFVDEPGLNYELTYFDDPQVYIPSSCANWVATTAMPDFLSKVHGAALVKRSGQREQLATV